MPRKRSVLAALFGVLVAAPAPAQGLDGRFFGGGTISRFSPACVAAGWSANSIAYSVRYQPAGLGWNGERSLLAFFADNQSFAFQIQGPFLRRWQPVEHLAIIDGAFLNTPAHDNPTRLRLLNQNPANLTAQTAGVVRLRGQVRNFAATTGCTVVFEVLLQQR